MLVDLELEMKRLRKLGLPSNVCELLIMSPYFTETRDMINSKEIHSLQIGDDVYFFDGDRYSKL